MKFLLSLVVISFILLASHTYARSCAPDAICIEPFVCCSSATVELYTEISNFSGSDVACAVRQMVKVTKSGSKPISTRCTFYPDKIYFTAYDLKYEGKSEPLKNCSNLDVTALPRGRVYKLDLEPLRRDGAKCILQGPIA